jgi:hypothetical protein
MTAKQIFEKFSGLLFLLLLIGMVAFLTFIPMPAASEKVILMIIGGLMAVATGALPRLLSADTSEEDTLRNKVAELETKLETLQVRYDEVNTKHDALMRLLVERHVIKFEGVENGA